jgi:hypothetical protein
MAKEFIYLKGKAKWARLQTPDPTYNKYNIVLYPDTESLEKIRELQAGGIKNVVKKDDDGYNVNFSRPASKLMKGKVVGFTPPEVRNADNTPFDGRIGNGSDVTLKIEVYGGKAPTGQSYMAARLEAIRIDNLIPYQPTEQEDFQAEGLDAQPKPNF